MMKLNTEFYHLPFRFDSAQLKQELSQISETHWSSHFPSTAGDTSLIMVSVGGLLNHDFALSGQTKPTDLLGHCPYFSQVLSTFNSPVSRCRITRLKAGKESPVQIDHNYHWFRRVSLYVPIVTNPAVKLFCNDKSIHMVSGDTWTFDQTLKHWMINGSDEDCIHLIIEIKGSSAFEKMWLQTEQPYASADCPHNLQVQEFPFAPNNRSPLVFEPYCFEVLTPQEIRDLTANILSEAEKSQRPQPEFLSLVRTIEDFRGRWKKAFSQFGHHPSGELAYQDLILDFNEQIVPKVKKRLSPEGKGRYAMKVISSMLSMSPPEPKRLSRQLLTKKRLKAKQKVHWDAHYQLVNHAEKQAGFQRLQEQSKWIPLLESFRSSSTLAEIWPRYASKSEITQSELTEVTQTLMTLGLLTENFHEPHFDRPLFIVSPPRAGSTLLFNTLSHFPNLWTIGEESHELMEGLASLHPSAHDFSSNRLSEVDAPLHISKALQKRFVQELQDRDGYAYLDLPIKQRPHQIRFLEKTPKNALRIPFLKTVFPEALFIYLYRDPRENISSMVECWRSRRFIAYQNLPGWPYKEWSFLLPPGWSSLQNRSLVEIAAYQWNAANSYILEDLHALPKASWRLIRYADLIQNPKETLREISQFAQFPWDQRIEKVVSQSLPVSPMTLSTPSPDKWRKHEREISMILADVEAIENRVAKL
ncbi:sulfotransferase [Deltaproteobacteria bacterium TL4]